MKSATTPCPVISASSLNVSPAFKLAEHMPRAAVAGDGSLNGAAQDHAEMGGFVPLVHDGCAGFEGPDSRALYQRLEMGSGE